MESVSMKYIGKKTAPVMIYKGVVCKPENGIYKLPLDIAKAIIADGNENTFRIMRPKNVGKNATS